MIFINLYLQLCRFNAHLEACAKEAKQMRADDRNSPLLLK